LDVLFTPPINQYLSMILLSVCIVFLALCIARFRAAYRNAGQYDASHWFIRGIRCLLISLTAAAWFAALKTGEKIEKGEKRFL
jgi:hypothetical protein